MLYSETTIREKLMAFKRMNFELPKKKLMKKVKSQKPKNCQCFQEMQF